MRKNFVCLGCLYNCRVGRPTVEDCKSSLSAFGMGYPEQLEHPERLECESSDSRVDLDTSTVLDEISLRAQTAEYTNLMHPFYLENSGSGPGASDRISLPF